jgi:hypothetical protein
MRGAVETPPIDRRSDRPRARPQAQQAAPMDGVPEMIDPYAGFAPPAFGPPVNGPFASGPFAPGPPSYAPARAYGDAPLAPYGYGGAPPPPPYAIDPWPPRPWRIPADGNRYTSGR